MMLDRQKIDERRNYLLEEINHKDLVSGKHKKVSGDLKNNEHYLFWLLLLLVMFQFLYLLY